MANLSAAEMLKAEMMSAVPVSAKTRREEYEKQRQAAIEEASRQAQAILDGVSNSPVEPTAVPSPTTVAGDPNQPAPESNQLDEPVAALVEEVIPQSAGTDVSMHSDSPKGIKRKIEELEADGDVATEESTVIEDDGDDEGSTSGDGGPSRLARKINPDGSVEQEDTVKLVSTHFSSMVLAYTFCSKVI